MDTYLETNINLLVRLSKEANDPNIDAKRYKIIAKGLCDILNTIDKYHGIYYLHYAAYAATLRLGHSLGPLNDCISFFFALFKMYNHFICNQTI